MDRNPPKTVIRYVSKLFRHTNPVLVKAVPAHEGIRLRIGPATLHSVLKLHAIEGRLISM